MNERSIFMEALDLDEPREREAHLLRACGDDDRLRARVEVLLRRHQEADGFVLDLVPEVDLAATVGMAPPLEEPGTTIGPYRLMEQIGEGGMGVVYVAEQSAPVRRRVALKVIKPGMDTKQVIARFEAERQALAMMDHPNIARVFDAGATDSGRPYFVMELVRGLPITDYCDREQLSIPERLDLFILVCRAVQHAHQKGIIHRDLKPSNVLVTVIDGAAVPKVIDFGIAKATGAALTDGTVYTGFHQLVGTPLYMSPEQADLSGVDVDTRSDIYSLGVLLYELLTGTTPFDAETLRHAAFDELRRILREDEPPTPSTRLGSLGPTLSTVSACRKADPRRLGPSLRSELDWVVMKALEKDRRRRYETANDFAADVMRYLTDQPVEACPPSAWYRFGKFARRNRAGLTTTVFVALALVAGLATTTWQAIEADRARRQTAAALETAERQRESARRAVDEMYTQVAEKWLAQQPKLTSLQREFLEKALAFYQELATETDSDPQVRHEALRALSRAGAIRQKLGQLAEAETAYRQIIDTSTKLGLQYPDRTDFLLERAVARIRLAMLLRSLGKGANGIQGVGFDFGQRRVEFASKSLEGKRIEAEQLIDQAGRDMELLRNDPPTDAEARRRLAEAYNALCGELTLARRIDEATAAIDAAFEIWKPLVRDFPSEIEHRYGLASCYARQGMQLTWWGGQNEEAEAALRQAERLLMELLEERPLEVRFRISLSTTQKNLGVILHRAKRQSEAEIIERRVVALDEGLAADFPDVPQYHESLVQSLSNLAAGLWDQRRYAEEEELLRRALAIGEQLAGRHPDVPEYEALVGSMLRRLAETLSRLENNEEARQLLEGAILRARSWLDNHPDERPASVNNGYSAALMKLPKIALRLGDRAGAGRIAEEWSQSVLSDFSGDELASPVTALCEAQLENSDETAQDTSLSTPQREATIQADQLRYKALIREAARRAPDTPSVLYRLADALTTVPEGLRDPELALRFAERAVELEPNNQEPNNQMARQSLGWALFRTGDWKGCIETLSEQDFMHCAFLAMAHWQLGDKARAQDLFDRADKGLADYETRWNSETYPYPSMLRTIQDEAAALLGVETPPDEGSAEHAPDLAESPE